MKILQINKFFYRRGGAEQHLFDLIDLLQAHGHSVIPFAGAHPKNEPSDYSRYWPSWVEWGNFSWQNIFSIPRLIYSREAKRKLAALIAAERPDIAHAHLIYHHLSPSVLVALKQAKIPVVLTIHDWKLLCPNYILYTEGELCIRCKDRKYIHAARHRCIHNKLLPSLVASLEAYVHHAKRYYEDYIDALIAPSDFVREMFIDFGWPSEKITVLPHFLSNSIERASSPAAGPSPILTIGASAVEPVFVYAGRLSLEKGIRELVNYWIDKKVPYRLDVFGSGELEEELRARVGAAHCASVVLQGAKPRAYIMEQLPTYSALIIPSLVYEIFGLVAIEAWAQGVPVVAHRRGALTELVTNSKAGVLFDWSEVGISLSDALHDLLAGRNTLAKHALSYLHRHHQSEPYYKALLDIYARLTNREP